LLDDLVLATAWHLGGPFGYIFCTNLCTGPCDCPPIVVDLFQSFWIRLPPCAGDVAPVFPVLFWREVPQFDFTFDVTRFLRDVGVTCAVVTTISSLWARASELAVGVGLGSACLSEEFIYFELHRENADITMSQLTLGFCNNDTFLQIGHDGACRTCRRSSTTQSCTCIPLEQALKGRCCTWYVMLLATTMSRTCWISRVFLCRACECDMSRLFVHLSCVLESWCLSCYELH